MQQFLLKRRCVVKEVYVPAPDEPQCGLVDKREPASVRCRLAGSSMHVNCSTMFDAKFPSVLMCPMHVRLAPMVQRNRRQLLVSRGIVIL